MGLKRIMFTAEVTFPADDPRSLPALALDVPALISESLIEHNGTLARLTVLSAAQDPDPEDSFTPEPPPAEPSPE